MSNTCLKNSLTFTQMFGSRVPTWCLSYDVNSDPHLIDAGLPIFPRWVCESKASVTAGRQAPTDRKKKGLYIDCTSWPTAKRASYTDGLILTITTMMWYERMPTNQLPTQPTFVKYRSRRQVERCLSLPRRCLTVLNTCTEQEEVRQRAQSNTQAHLKGMWEIVPTHPWLPDGGSYLCKMHAERWRT